MNRRRSLRLPDYDYASDGAYFVTLCSHQRRPIFGRVIDGAMTLNAWGQVVQSSWQALPTHFPNTLLDAFVVMPNHLHGILIIVETVHGGAAPTTSSSTLQAGSLGAIVGQFKSRVTKRIRESATHVDTAIWQRNYYDHIIRRDTALDAIRNYIAENPLQWAADRWHRED